MQTGMACVSLQESSQLCLGSALHFNPEHLDCACRPCSHHAILNATEIHQNPGRNESRGGPLLQIWLLPALWARCCIVYQPS